MKKIETKKTTETEKKGKWTYLEKFLPWYDKLKYVRFDFIAVIISPSRQIKLRRLKVSSGTFSVEGNAYYVMYNELYKIKKGFASFYQEGNPNPLKFDFDQNRLYPGALLHDALDSNILHTTFFGANKNKGKIFLFLLIVAGLIVAGVIYYVFS